MPLREGAQRAAARWASLSALLVLLLLSLPGVLEAAPGTRHRVGPEGAALRAEPSAAAPLVAQLAEGTRLLEYRRTEGWIKVAVLGAVAREGWLEAARLLPEEPPGPPPRVPEPPPEPAARQPEARRFLLLVEGPLAHRFHGTCRLSTAEGGERELDLEGLMPQSYEITGGWISCSLVTLEARRLEVELWADGRLLDSDEAGVVLLKGGGLAQERAHVSAPRSWR